MTSSILLKTSKIIPLPPDSIEQQRRTPLLPCTLKWRKAKLWVKRKDGSSVLPALESEQWLGDCLKKSPVQLVCVDPNLGETSLRIWANACLQANKQIFLRIPSHQKKFEQNSIGWRFKRMMDLSLAVLLLLCLSPVLLGIALLVKTSPGPVFFRQWRVGKRGKLFQIFKFRTMVADAEKRHDEVMGSQSGLHKREDDPRITAVGRWLRRYSLDELPQLFNVLRGEMSLVGPRPWALYDALRLGAAGRQRLNALPGMTGAWQVQARSKLLNLKEVTECDLEYLNRWSLGKDVIILLMTIPRVISGFGAH